MNFPNKPWVDGQEAELVAGSNFIYDSSKDAWVVNQDTIDSDLQALITNDISAVADSVIVTENQILVIQGRLDSDYAANNAKFASVESRVTALEGVHDYDIEDLDSDIQTNALNITSLQGRATTTEGDVSALEATTAVLAARLDSDETVIQDLQTQVDALNSNGLTGVRDDMDSDRGDILSKLADEVSTLVSVDSVLANRLDSDYELNNSKHAVQEALIDANRNAIDVLRTSADKDSDALTALTERVEDLESEADSDVADIARLRREADSDTAAIQAASTLVLANQQSIQTILDMLDSDGVNLQQLRTDLDAEIAATNADVASVNSAASALNTRVTTAESDITSIEADITSIEADVTAVDAKVDANASDLDSEMVSLGRQWNQATTPANPGPNDFWYDTSTGYMFVYNSTQSVWVQVTY